MAISELFKSFLTGFDQFINTLDNEYLITGVIVLLVLYSGMLSTKLTNPILPIINNALFKALLMLVCYLTFSDNKAVSIMLFIALCLSLQTSKKAKVIDSISKIDNEIEIINDEPEHIEEVHGHDHEHDHELIESTNDIENNVVQTEEVNMSDELPLEENKIDEESIMIQNSSISPISRVLVEEEIKKVHEIENETGILPEANDNNVFATISGIDKSSPLEEQIKNVQDLTFQDGDNIRSSRGLKVNSKCNLCSLKKQGNANVSPYEGESLANF